MINGDGMLIVGPFLVVVIDESSFNKLIDLKINTKLTFSFKFYETNCENLMKRKK